MKLQDLAILFVIIVLPISLVLNAYTTSKVDTLNMQISYDSKLNTATNDALKAFQMNTLYNIDSSQADSKMRDIKASVNTFFYAIENAFSLSSYNKEALQNYVPALVYTLYDGYYIYSPFTNTLDEKTDKKIKNYEETEKENATYQNGEIYFNLKPYVYYSCRYKNKECDVVITYSLDSYITIQGKIGNNYVNESGYLLSGVEKKPDGNYKYRSVDIAEKEILKEKIIFDGEEDLKEYAYQKINGRKYYIDNDGQSVFIIENYKKVLQPSLSGKLSEENANGKKYYEQAYEFKQKFESGGILEPLTRLTTAEAVDVDKDGKEISLKNRFGDYPIFKERNNNSTKTQIEDETSEFNNHRVEVIKYAIEKNLSVAISNFNHYSNAGVNFQMPMLKDYEWEQLANHVSIISFMQGLNIGGKVYNGYSLITNTKTKEFVSPDSIYITDGKTYYDVKDKELAGKKDIDLQAISNVEFLKTAGKDKSGNKIYYYRREELASYGSLVLQNNLEKGSTDKYLEWVSNDKLRTAYYTALGRERVGMYRVNTLISSL